MGAVVCSFVHSYFNLICYSNYNAELCVCARESERVRARERERIRENGMRNGIKILCIMFGIGLMNLYFVHFFSPKIVNNITNATNEKK